MLSSSAPANPQVCPRAPPFGDERVGRLLNTVVEESIGSLRAKDQPGTGGLQERSVEFFFGLSENHTQRSDLHHVSETGELLESKPASWRAIA